MKCLEGKEQVLEPVLFHLDKDIGGVGVCLWVAFKVEIVDQKMELNRGEKDGSIMSKDNVIVTGVDVVVSEEVIGTAGGDVVEEDVIVTIETEEPKVKAGKKKILKAVFAGGLLILGAMVIFSAGFYTGSHAGGSSGGRSKGDRHVIEKVEPIIIETEEGFLGTLKSFETYKSEILFMKEQASFLYKGCFFYGQRDLII